MKGIRVYTQEWSADQYSQAVENGGAPDPTDETGELLEIDDAWRENFGEWTDVDASPYVFGDAYVPATDVMVAFNWLSGTTTGFYASECSDTAAEITPRAWYMAEQNVNAYTGEVEEMAAHLEGDWTVTEAREIRRLTLGR